MKTRYQSLRASRLVLIRSAPLVRLLLFGLGFSMFLDQARPLISDAQFTWGERRVMGIVALFLLGGFGLAGWLAGRLLKASAELIDVFIDGADAAWRAADLIELQMVPALGRVANALEKTSAGTLDDERARAVAMIRRAIAEGRWPQAERLIEALARDHPGSPESSILPDELARARGATVAELRTRLEAARGAGDAARVIEIRDVLTQHLRGESLSDLDREVVRWLQARVQERVRAGTVDAGVASLAARIADSFGDTPEGSGLRASLPTLRRSAGLCVRCARPYQGSSDACPQCRARLGPVPRSASGLPLPKDQS